MAGAGILAGFATLVAKAPEHFHMILAAGNAHYKELPGLSVLIGGMWIANVSYWGCNQYIVQRALAAKSISPPSAGTFPTDSGLFVGLLVGVIVIVGGLTYFPAVALGPLAEQFAMQAGTLF